MIESKFDDVSMNVIERTCATLLCMRSDEYCSYSACVCVCLSISLSVCLSVCLFVSVCLCLSVVCYLSVCLFLFIGFCHDAHVGLQACMVNPLTGSPQHRKTFIIMGFGKMVRSEAMTSYLSLDAANYTNRRIPKGE